MNKRFKGPRFDKRIMGDMKDLIDVAYQLLQVNIITIGKNTDAIINGRDHKYNGPETTVGSGMIDKFF